MKDIILVNTPLSRDKFISKEKFLPPIGLGYIQTYLEEENLEVELLDSLFLNLSVEEIKNIIKKERPRFVGLNVFTPNMEIVKEIIEGIPDEVEIILGGQVMKNVYQDFVKWNVLHILHIVIGEGELIIPDIVCERVKESPILETGLCKVYHVTSESLYFPYDLSKIKLNRNIFKNRNMINHFGLEEACMISSRGCLYQCAFCGAANGRNKDTICRERKEEDLLEEINQIKRFTPNVSCIRMLDDLFLRNRHSIIKAMDIFKKVNLNWRAMAHILSFKCNEDLIPLLKESGCLELFVGIESGSESMRKFINKSGDVAYVTHIIQEMLRNGISVKGYFMYGFPDETNEDMNQTYQLAKKLHTIASSVEGNFRNSTFQFRPYHGTELYNYVMAKGKKIGEFVQDKKLQDWKGRQQFNIVSGNYSACSQVEIDNYISRTLLLNEK